MRKAYFLVAAFVSMSVGVGPTTSAVAVNTTNETAEKQQAKAPVYQTWKDAARNRKIPVKIYLPNSGVDTYPVVIFSHGLGGSCEAASYLGEYWAQHGYLGIFIQHHGSDSEVWQSSIRQGKAAMMQNMKEAANGKNLLLRTQDVKFVLDELQRRNQSDPVLKNLVDMDKISLAGHSFGAGTSLAVAGQNFGEAGKGLNTKDTRIKSAIYLCPPVSKMPADRAYGEIKIPGLLLTGTEDNSPINNTKASQRRIPYEGIQSPHQYFVNIVGADHAAFGGRSFRGAKADDGKFHVIIEKVSLEFLDATLKNEKAAWKWLDDDGIKSYLGTDAMFERK